VLGGTGIHHFANKLERSHVNAMVLPEIAPLGGVARHVLVS
jgi:hypothetical protein